MLPEKKTGGTADLIDRPEDTGRRDSVAHSEQSTGTTPLLAANDSQALRDRWQQCQVGFVDEPREAVKQADELVAELMQTLARQFAEAREGLERQWARGDDVSTEDLRVALQRYREFFNRLLTI